MRFAPVTCVISSFAPSAFATISASSMSKPSGWRCWLTEPKGVEDEKVGLQDGHQSNLRKRRLATKCMPKPVKSQARLKIVVIQSAGKVLGVLKVSVANGATKPATMTASPKLLRKVAVSL